MRHLTPEEVDKIYKDARKARFSLYALEKHCSLRRARLSEALRGRTKLSDEEISRVFANLASSQPIAADQGQRMLCMACKKNLTAPGQRKCAVCRATAEGLPASNKEVPPLVDSVTALKALQELELQGKVLASTRADVEHLSAQVSSLLRANPQKPEPTTEVPNSSDLIVSFVNFERVCRQMRTKCPHLFAATVRRACEAK